MYVWIGSMGGRREGAREGAPVKSTLLDWAGREDKGMEWKGKQWSEE